MTISATTTKQFFTGNGVTVAFTIPFAFQEQANVVAKLFTPSLSPLIADTVVTLILGTNYTISGTGLEPGGILTMVVAPTALQVLEIMLDPVGTQATDIPSTGPLPVGAIETSLDKLTLLVQAAKSLAGRAVKANELDYTLDLTLPRVIGKAGSILALNLTETGIEYGMTLDDFSDDVTATAVAATNANTAATAAAASATASSASAGTANSSAAAALVSQTAAAASAAGAAGNAAGAFVSETNAATSLAAAQASQIAAANSASASATSATNAANSAASFVDMRQGSGVPSNALGLDGDGYFDYTAKYVYQKVAGAYVLRSDLSVATGSGGALVRFGSGVPSNALGADDDTYVDVTTGVFYLRAAGAYTSQYTDQTPVDSVNGYTGTVVLIKDDVGLANADNTSDASKPLSTANVAALATKADIASPTFTGVPAAPTAAAATNTTQLATTAFVTAALAAAPGGVTSAFSRTGAVVAAAGDYTATQITNAPAGSIAATTVQAAITELDSDNAALSTALASKAPIASPTFSGTPTAPTPAAGTNTTQVATTAFVLANSAAGRAVSSFTGTVITPSTTSKDETNLYTGVTAQTFTGFGSLAGLTNGHRFRVMGSDDANTLTINHNDVANGWLTNGIIELGRGQWADGEYNSTLARVIF